MLTRRSLFFGGAAALAAPSIVRPGLLMPVRAFAEPAAGWAEAAAITRAALRILDNELRMSAQFGETRLYGLAGIATFNAAGGILHME